MPGRRNRIALNPIMRKGGAHQRSRSANRRIENELLDAAMEDWYEDDNQSADLLEADMAYQTKRERLIS